MQAANCCFLSEVSAWTSSQDSEALLRHQKHFLILFFFIFTCISEHLCSLLVHLAPPAFLSHIWLQSFLPASFHLFHIFVTVNPQFPATSYFFLTLIWLYYSIHDSLNLSLPYLSQLTKHLFFAVFSSNLPSFISIFYSWLHYFRCFFFSLSPSLLISPSLSSSFSCSEWNVQPSPGKLANKQRSCGTRWSSLALYCPYGGAAICENH